MNNCSIFLPLTLACGQYGNCSSTLNQLNQPFCVCLPGYSSIGDFSVFPSNPCDINITAVRALWIISLLGIAFAYSFSFWGIITRRVANLFQWKSWRLWIVPYLIITQTTLLLVIAIGKIIDPIGWSLGNSTAMTVIHGFCTLVSATFLVIGLAGVSRTAYTGNIRTQSSNERLIIKNRLRRLETVITCFWFLAAVSAFAPCSSLYNPENVWWSTAIHGCGFAIEMVVLGSFVAPRQLSVVIERLEDSVKASINSSKSNSKVKKVLLKFQLTKKISLVFFSTSAIVILVFTLWPFLVIKTSYGLPIFYLLAEIAAGLLVWVTTTTSNVAFRKPSQAMKRLSQAITSARKSVEKRRKSVSERDSQILANRTSSVPEKNPSPSLLSSPIVFDENIQSSSLVKKTSV